MRELAGLVIGAVVAAVLAIGWDLSGGGLRPVSFVLFVGVGAAVGGLVGSRLVP